MKQYISILLLFILSIYIQSTSAVYSTSTTQIVTTNTTYQWIDLTTTATSLTDKAGTLCQRSIPIGFTFPLNGFNFTQTNGIISGFVYFQESGNGGGPGCPWTGPDCFADMGQLLTSIFAVDSVISYSVLSVLSGDNSYTALQTNTYTTCPWTPLQSHKCFIMTFNDVTTTISNTNSTFMSGQAILVDNGVVVMQYKKVGSGAWPGRIGGLGGKTLTSADSVESSVPPKNCSVPASFNGNVAVYYIPPTTCDDTSAFNGFECVQCAVGKKPDGTFTSCVNCASYQIAPSAGVCQDCTGKQARNGNGSACVDCTGKQVPNSNHGACVNCPSGQYTTDNMNCKACGQNEQVNDAGNGCEPKSNQTSGAASSLSLFGLW